MIMHTFVLLAYKESPYLEQCIVSVKQQIYTSKLVIATSTKNKYIETLAEKYQIPIIENIEKKGIGFDFDFAISCANTELVTVAHQDDIYDKEYARKMIEAYEKYQDATIIFSDYYEIRNGEKMIINTNLRIKRILLSLVKIKKIAHYRMIKRSCLSLGNAICCPAVTFVKNNIPYQDVFACEMKCDIDWYAWERLSREKGRFLFINECLMGHRVHEESTTTEIISDNIRTKEDLIMFKKFWPVFIAKILNKFYIKSEKSNKV